MDEFEKWDEATDYSHFVSPYTVAKAAWKAGREAGMREASEICRVRSVDLEVGNTDHTEEGCYECGAEEESDYLYHAILSAIEGAK